MLTISHNFQYDTLQRKLPLVVKDAILTYHSPAQFTTPDGIVQKVKIDNKIVLTTLDTALTPSTSQQIDGSITQFNSPQFPWERNMAQYGKFNSIHGELTIDSLISINITNTIVEKIHNHINKKLETVSPQSRSLLTAILLADKTELSPRTKFLFNEGGVSHLLAISGFHVGLFILILSLILKLLPLHLTLKRTLLLTVPWIILIFTGPVPSTVRALIMSSTLFGAYLCYRSPSGFNSLGIAGIICLSINPLQLFTAGFQLSFTAVFAILLTLKLFREYNIPIHLQKRYGTVVIPLIVAIFVTPITISFFNSLVPRGALSNIVFVPLFALIVTVTIPLFLISPSNTQFIPKSINLIFETMLNTLETLLSLGEIEKTPPQLPNYVYITLAVALLIAASVKLRLRTQLKVWIYTLMGIISIFLLNNFRETNVNDLICSQQLHIVTSAKYDKIDILADTIHSKPIAQWILRQDQAQNLILSGLPHKNNELLRHIYRNSSYTHIYSLVDSVQYEQQQEHNNKNITLFCANDTLIIDTDTVFIQAIP